MAVVVHFLLVYDHRLQRLVAAPREFRNGSEAAVAYAELEAEHRNDRDLEIVLVGADSIETIRRTHAHYFAAVDNPFPELVAQG